MTGWNHRVITNGSVIWVGEVYYGRDGEVTGYTGPGSSVLAIDAEFSAEDLRADAELLMSAFDLPVIEVEWEEDDAASPSWKPVHGVGEPE